MKLLAVSLVIVVLFAAGYARFASDPPGYDRARLHHWRNAEAMTALAERVLEIPDLRWVALDDGNVIGSFGEGANESLPGPLATPLQAEVLQVLKKARIGHIFVDGKDGTAFVELLYWWPVRDRTYSMMFLFRGSNRIRCAPEVWKTSKGACQVPLDENWTLKYLWYPRFVPEVSGRGDS